MKTSRIQSTLLVGIRFFGKLTIIVLLLAICEPVYSYTVGTQNDVGIQASEFHWLSIIEQIRVPKLDTLALPITRVRFSNVDFSLDLEAGTLYLFEPALIDNKPIYYGGYFVGQGQFRFKPRISTERFQVKRFYQSDSVLNYAKNVIIFFNESASPDLTLATSSAANKLSNENRKSLEFGFQAIKYNGEYSAAYLILKNLTCPQSDSFLFVHSINEKFDHDQYIFDPLDREEVKLGKAYHEWDGVELVCSYNRNVDESLRNINGPRKDDIYPLQYRIEAKIDLKGMLAADVVLQAQVVDESARFFTFYLHPDIEIESVEAVDGQSIEFVRDRSRGFNLPLLYVFLPRVPFSDTLYDLRFRYHGIIAALEYGLYYVDASTHWYPRFDDNRWSNFDLFFKSPKDFTLVASSSLVDSSTSGDTLYSHWRTSHLEKGVTFNIAGFDIHRFEVGGLPLIEVCHNKPLHDDLMKGYKKDWFKNISSSIIDPVKLFSNVYGQPYRDYLRVTEILYSHGESFPGFINLPYWTFSSKNVWGNDLLIRSHEIAHQWWGSSVGYETYHDQWLSEGLATYSSLRYCNTVVENQRFLEKLREFRDKVFSVRKTWFASGEEAGPIIQGYRTSSSKTQGDYQLIIYEKAALVLHMLRCHLTDWNTLDHSRFNRFLKDFYQRYAGKNASTQDFRNVLEEHTGVDWGWFFNQWIYGNELPVYTFHKVIKKDNSDGLWRAYCKIEQEEVGSDFVVIMPIEIDFDKSNKLYTAYVVRGKTTEFTLTFDQEPKEIRLNPFEAVLAIVRQ